ncbi:MAG TPA: bifunctional aspartate kinase/diaminopimelate decarboxylase [Deltaproteobacteria bacterium]|nr:bifunctional aspartate kinase/diaminopimelate decarboxylase [Deltaproteobacteria bacterium]
MNPETPTAPADPRPWIVLKFGGTSVANAERWEQIAQRIRQLLPDYRVWIVASALSQVSNHLEAILSGARAGDDPQGQPLSESLDWIRTTHGRLAQTVGIEDEAFTPVADLLAELERFVEGIALTSEAPPRLHARVMSFGELASTHLGLAILARHGIEATRVDARHLLTSSDPPGTPESTRFLSASVQATADPDAGNFAAGGAEVVITQGFIAKTEKGETCLLGRGGSDTSAALFAALLEAESLEIWTDVHGLFTTDPRQIPSARLIRRITYREAQELAAMGAKVLHPRCLDPAARAGIPVCIRNTQDPDVEGTRIGSVSDSKPSVMAVVRRSGVTLLTVSTLEMWGASGFLARVFAPFEALGISVDLVATSQSAVSITLDGIPGGIEGDAFQALLASLKRLGTVQVIGPCAVVSIVGRRIRTVLHELGSAFSVFREHEVHLVSESSEDLNLSFVVEEEDAAKLVAALHSRLLPLQGNDELFGPSWEMLAANRKGAQAAPSPEAPSQPPTPWWRTRRDELLTVGAETEACYVYDLATVARQARTLTKCLPSVGQLFYSVKANPHPRILETIAREGLGMECVSAAEVSHVRGLLGETVPILFTPNFCPVEEYRLALEAGAEVTLDGPHLLEQAPELFANRDLALRVDPGGGAGHHEKVRTAGAHAKFGQPWDEVAEVVEAAASCSARITGLHAHVGSGILEAAPWARTASRLAGLRDQLPDLQWIDLGGGLGVVERPGQSPLDLHGVNEAIQALHEVTAGLELRMEPGRFLVSEAGVLLARVTQVRQKGEVRFVGLATGMNSLLRPALYGAWHGIHNLSRVDAPLAGYSHVVGPICETGDVLGRNRLLPETQPDDLVLIENCGAYGAVMSSRYNLREPASEVCLDDSQA